MSALTISGHCTNSLSAKCFVIIMGDLNGDLGNYLGGRGKYDATDRGFRILDVINFSICAR